MGLAFHDADRYVPAVQVKLTLHHGIQELHGESFAQAHRMETGDR